ncbi:fibropellin-3-like isoform X2 [Ruditapes philippinarum]|nr:fibropellin-3-like isoform X2 [Ruditapes philippinarum]
MCFDKTDDFKCECRPGHSGKKCDAEIDECSTNPCENGGTCIDEYNAFHCNCTEGFVGRRCQIPVKSLPPVHVEGCPPDDESCETDSTPIIHYDICEINVPCHNGAICRSWDNDRYSCDCLSGFTGSNCETDIDECMSSPCQNGGACIDEVDAFYCKCDSAYPGDYCEIDLYNSCAASPCQGNGTCTQEENGYNCTCPPGIVGLNCEAELDECASDPCKNAGTCEDRLDGYNCTCQVGYTGKDCEIELDECASDPCKNAGTCEDRLDGYNCTCQVGYTGKDCEIDHWPKFFIFIAFVVGLLIVICGLLCKRRRMYIMRKLCKIKERGTKRDLPLYLKMKFG